MQLMVTSQQRQAARLELVKQIEEASISSGSKDEQCDLDASDHSLPLARVGCRAKENER